MALPEARGQGSSWRAWTANCAADRGEATLSQVAYLTDRVRLGQGQPQVYGTQATGRNGEWVPCSLRDPEAVDERRAAMTPGSPAENLARIAEQYGPPVPAVTACPACGARTGFWPPGPGEEAAAECGACGITVRFGAARLASP